MQIKDNKTEEPLIEIKGTVEHIIYQNEENGYCVAELLSDDDEEITIVGILPFIAAGETVKASGNWVLNPKFGRQFKALYFEKILPKTQSGILKYLSSRTIPGIGPSTAKKIVERFGVESFDVIENHPEMLTAITGISRAKADSISDAFRAQNGIRDVMDFCREYFTPSQAVDIYNRYGSSAIDLIEENPYILCDDDVGIAFETVDKIALHHGIKKDSDLRLKAGMKYLLRFNSFQNGHVYIPKKKLVEAVSQMFEVEESTSSFILSELVNEGELCAVKLDGHICIYTKEMYDAERYICGRLLDIDNNCPSMELEDAEILIQRIEAEEHITYAPMQKKAIVSALSSGLMILTGGPGTGKTTVIKALLSIFEELGLDVALAAPTGRAAKRMSEATGMEAKTIHRMLEIEYSSDNTPKFHRCDSCKLDEDVVIVDEVSMLDTLLTESLLHAIKPGARLLFIGDADQLPSVGAGNILHDLIKSGVFNVIRLNKIFRQAEESLIITNAHLINNGEYPELESTLSDFFFIPRETDADIINTVKDLYSRRLPKRYGAEIKAQIQVIAPSRKGEAGASMLNAVLQAELNPPSKTKAEKKIRDVIFRVGDKVMQIKNNYDIAWEAEDRSGIGIFNGDIGTIEAIDRMSENAVIRFDDDRVAVYDFTMLDELEHAYAITVHKSQGSEYPVLIIPIYSFSRRLLTRNLLYTAVTRARDMVVMVGRADVVRGMVDNNVETKRYTGLDKMLKAAVICQEQKDDISDED